MSELTLEASYVSASAWQDNEARQRALFREVNERVAELGLTFAERGLLALLCECGDAGCTQRIELTPEEYEAVRAHARRFVIAPNHENQTVEIVVAERTRFAVVETLVGEASRIAEETDPRAATPGGAAELAERASAKAKTLRGVRRAHR